MDISPTGRSHAFTTASTSGENEIFTLDALKNALHDPVGFKTLLTKAKKTQTKSSTVSQEETPQTEDIASPISLFGKVENVMKTMATVDFELPDFDQNGDAFIPKFSSAYVYYDIKQHILYRIYHTSHIIYLG